MRLKGTPTSHRIKNTPVNSDLIYNLPEEGASRQSFLAKVDIPFNETRSFKHGNVVADASYGRTNDANLNSPNNTTASYMSRFDLWITEVTYGFMTGGPVATSKYYKRHYTQAFALTPITVTGICYNENEYDDLSAFIREGQVSLSQDPNNVFRLYVPAAKVDVVGAIELMKGGFISDNKGMTVAPKFQFDFLIFIDLNDTVQNIGSTAKTIIYNFNEDPYWVRGFNSYKNDYITGSLINDTTPNGTIRDQRKAVKTVAKTVQQAGSILEDFFNF